MSHYKTIDAAEALLASSTKNMWALADAVLLDVPPQEAGRPTKSDDARIPISEQLESVAEELAEQGITTPSGDTYSAASLDVYRNTAMAWPVDERHPEAAYRTHQEAGGRESSGRIALAALCRIARGERVQCPKELDKTSWEYAVARVRERLNGRRLRYAVTANDVRAALARRQNVPAARRFSPLDLLGHLDDSRRYLIAFRLDFAEHPELSRDDLAAIVRAIDSLVEEAFGLREAASADLTEEALAEMLSQEEQS